MKNLNPYIRFDGNCREAMNFYRDCLGGELSLMTVAETPIADQCPAGSGNQIMHSSLTGENFSLMATDMSRPGAPMGPGVISIVINCSSEEEVTRLFNAMGEGGEVICPLSPAFWGGTFGITKDKYGIGWMFNYVKE